MDKVRRASKQRGPKDLIYEAKGCSPQQQKLETAPWGGKFSCVGD